MVIAINIPRRTEFSKKSESITTMPITFQDITLRPMPKAISHLDIVKIFSLFRMFNACHLPFPSGQGYKSLAATILASNILKGTPLRIEDALLPTARMVHAGDSIEDSLLETQNSEKADSTPSLFVVHNSYKPLGWVHVKHLMLEVFYKGTPRVGSIMRSSAAVIDNPHCTIYEVHKRILESRQSCVLIADGKDVLGLISNKTVSRLVDWGCDIWNMKAINVARKIPSIRRATSLQEAYTECLRSEAERAVVINDRGPIGIVNLNDIVNALSIQSQQLEQNGTPPKKDNGLHENDFLDIVVGTSMNTGILGLTDHLRVVYFNNTFHHMLGEQPAIRIGSDIKAVSEICNTSVHKMLTSIERANSGEEQTFTAWKKTANTQHKLQFKLNSVRIDGKEAGYVIAVQDVTEQHNAQKKMQRLAYYDSLTNLPNRSLFKERFQSELHKAQREQTRLALMMMDLDGFKAVNDTYGHTSGDVLLARLGKRLKETVRETDTVGRFGGDEFVFIFPQVTNRDSAEQVAEKLLEAVSAPINIQGRTMQMGASVGIAVFPEDGSDFTELLNIADSRMFYQKRFKRRSLTSEEALPSKS